MRPILPLSRVTRVFDSASLYTKRTPSRLFQSRWTPVLQFQAPCLLTARAFSTTRPTLPRKVPTAVRESLFVLEYKFQSLDKENNSSDQIIGALNQLLTAVRQGPGIAKSLLDVICCDARYGAFERNVLIPAIRSMDVKQTLDLVRCVSLDARSNENLKTIANLAADRLATLIEAAPHACSLEALQLTQPTEVAQIMGLLYQSGVSSDTVERVVRAMTNKATNWAEELHKHGASWVELSCFVAGITPLLPAAKPLVPIAWDLFERVSSDPETAGSRGVLAVYGAQLALGLSQLLGTQDPQIRASELNMKLIPRIAEMTPLMSMSSITDLLLTLVNVAAVIDEPSSDTADQDHCVTDLQGLIKRRTAVNPMMQVAAWETIKMIVRRRLSEITTLPEAQLLAHCLFSLDWIKEYDVNEITGLLTKALNVSVSGTVPTPVSEVAENVHAASSDLVRDLFKRCSAPFAWNTLKSLMQSPEMPPEISETDRLWVHSLELAAQDPQKSEKIERDLKFDDVVESLRSTGVLSDANLATLLFTR